MSELWSYLNPRTTLQLGRDWIRSTKPTLTPDDVRHALGGLREKPFLFGMAAFLGDPRSLHRLECIVIEQLQTVANAEGWIRRRRHHRIVNRMGSLMLFEVISARSRAEPMPGEAMKQRAVAHILCPACSGKGISPARTACQLCRASGRFTLNERIRAETVGVGPQRWRALWGARYAEHIEIPRRWEHTAIAHVKRRLRND